MTKRNQDAPAHLRCKKSRCKSPVNDGRDDHDDAFVPDVAVVDGYRIVRPYFFTYKSFAKQRWFGRTILDVMLSEFRYGVSSYYHVAIERGFITVNGTKVNHDYRFKNGDVMRHFSHRHEAPIAASAIDIIYRTDDLVVIDKPASIPVHPTGRYNFNSLAKILRTDYDIKEAFFINRLDRLTSGLMVIPLSAKKASQLAEQMKNGQIKKEYICRVKGEFPEEEVVVDQPIAVASHKLTLHCISPDGKHAMTRFKRKSFDGQYSIVSCWPETGRTHQIRLHLQHLKFPIANDPLYNQDYADYLKSDDCLKLIEPTKNWEENKPKLTEDEQDIVSYCVDCNNTRYIDPIQQQQVLWLHALKYEGPEWMYGTKLPTWALDITGQL